MTDWEVVLTGSLQAVPDMGCNVPIETFELTSPRQEQYIKFTANSYHGTGGAGLQFIGFEEGNKNIWQMFCLLCLKEN